MTTAELVDRYAAAVVALRIAENRLAKVPALVEAASNAKSWIENYPLNAKPQEADWIALTNELGEALAGLEQA